MIWQDVVISVGQFVFAVAMIPTIMGSSKPALASSVVTAIGLTVFALTFSTLGLWLSVAGTATGALTWWIVAAQSWALLSLSEILRTGALPNGMQVAAQQVAEEMEDELIRGSDPHGPDPVGILNICHKGFDRDCGLPSGHAGDCVTRSHLHCHAGSDGDCSWEHCPQEANNRANYQTYCPLAKADEARYESER